MYFAHKDFLFSIVKESLEKYDTEKKSGYSVVKKRHKSVKKIDKDEMAKTYQEMGSINLEEVNASVHTYEDGMDFYK